MLDVAEKPRLRITHKNAAHLYGVCSLCEHRLHAFIRKTEQHAMLLLNRGFKYHCRTRHRTVIAVSTRISSPRRSTRIPADILIEVQGDNFAYAGETITVNLHGALVRIAAPLKPGDCITVHVYSTGMSAQARVVFAEDELKQVGIELQNPENIWGVALPPADWKLVAPRSSN